jgi:hypothetical protein
MAALTQDIATVEYGTRGNSSQPLNFPLKANTTVYRGSIAITRSGVAVPALVANLATATDVCWGIFDEAGPGTADTGPGITGGTVDGAVTVDVSPGTYFLASSTGSDLLGPTTLGKTVYVYDEFTVAATQNTTRPVAGIHIYTDSTRTDAPGIYAIKLGSAQSSGSP